MGTSESAISSQLRNSLLFQCVRDLRSTLEMKQSALEKVRSFLCISLCIIETDLLYKSVIISISSSATICALAGSMIVSIAMFDYSWKENLG